MLGKVREALGLVQSLDEKELDEFFRGIKIMFEERFEQRKAEGPSFIVAFDSALSHADLIKAGNYNFVNPSITSVNFPLNAEGKTGDEAFILHFDRMVTSEQAIAEMDKQGLCPATITHALAFGAQHPEEQRKYPIIFLGSSWMDSDGGRFVPCLGVGDGERGLDLDWFGTDWDASCRFAAVRKPREHSDFLQQVGHVKVIFDTTMSFDDLVKAGKYNGVKPEITVETFPMDTEGKTEDEIFFFSLSVPLTTDRIIEEMDKKGFRPATSTHALVFGAQNTAEKPIVFLGTNWQKSDQQRYVIALDFDRHERRLILAWLDGHWHTYNYFAAVRN